MKKMNQMKRMVKKVTAIPKLDTFFPNYIQGVFFDKMPDAPWASVEGVGKTLDLLYFGTYSGQKLASNLVRDNSVDGVANSQLLAASIWSIYGNSWTKLWNAAQMQYDITNNYNVSEHYERVADDDRGIDRTRTDAGESKDSTSSITDTTSTNSQDNSTRAFNSDSPVPTTSTNGSGTDHTIETSTVDGTTSNDTSENTIDKLHSSESYTRTRIGNVGQNTYQELIKQELDLWKWNLYSQLFEDADRFMVLSVYDTCGGIL